MNNPNFTPSIGDPSVSNLGTSPVPAEHSAGRNITGTKAVGQSTEREMLDNTSAKSDIDLDIMMLRLEQEEREAMKGGPAKVMISGDVKLGEPSGRDLDGTIEHFPDFVAERKENTQESSSVASKASPFGMLGNTKIPADAFWPPLEIVARANNTTIEEIDAMPRIDTVTPDMIPEVAKDLSGNPTATPSALRPDKEASLVDIELNDIYGDNLEEELELKEASRKSILEKLSKLRDKLLGNKTQEKEIAPKTQIVELGNGTGSIKAKNPADAEVVAEEPDKESPTEEEIERARGVKAALKAGKDWAGDFEYVDIDDPIVPQNKSTIPDIVPSTVIPEIVKKPAIVQTVSDTKVESVAPPSDLAPEFVITLPPHNYGNLVTPLPAQSVPVPDVARSFKQLVDISLGNDRQEMPPIPKKPTTITQKLSTLRNKLFPMMSPEADIAFKAQEARKKIISSLDTAHVWWEKQPKHQRLILSVALIGLGLVGTAGGSGLAIGASLAGKAVLRGLGAYGLGTTASSFAKKKLLEKNNGAPLSKETESKLRKAKYAIALGAFLAGSYSDIKDVYNLAHDAFSGATQAVDTVLVKPGPILPITDSLPSTEHSVLPVDTHGAARKVANLAGHTIEHFENVIPNRTLTGIILHGGIFEMATLDDIAKLTVDGKQNFIQNLIENLSPEQLKSVGITSGNPDLLRLTDKINILKLAELAKTITVSVGGEKISLLARALQIK